MAVNVTGQRNELLPVDNPVARENQQKQHELRIANHYRKIVKRARNTGSRLASFSLGLSKQH